MSEGLKPREVICPECQGQDTGTALICGERNGVHYSETKAAICRVCSGEHKITTEHAARLSEGHRRRTDRISRGLSQREEAARLGIDTRDLNDIEHGREPRQIPETQRHAG